MRLGFTVASALFLLGNKPKPSLLDTKQQEKALVSRYLAGELSRRDFFAAAEKGSRKSAAQALAELSAELPAFVASAVSAQRQKPAGPEYAAADLERAREVLNGMIETATAEYDLKSMECMAFEERNRHEFGLVTAELSRLGSAIAGDNGKILGTKKAITDASKATADVRADLEEHLQSCANTRLGNEATLQALEADLAVATFIIKLVECKSDERPADVPSSSKSPAIASAAETATTPPPVMAVAVPGCEPVIVDCGLGCELTGTYECNGDYNGKGWWVKDGLKYDTPNGKYPEQFQVWWNDGQWRIGYTDTYWYTNDHADDWATPNWMPVGQERGPVTISYAGEAAGKGKALVSTVERVTRVGEAQTSRRVAKCRRADNSTYLTFEDPALAQKAASLLSPFSKDALALALADSHPALAGDPSFRAKVQQHAAALVAKARRASTGGLPADEAALALPAFATVTVARAANLTVPKEEGPAPVPAATEPDPADAATKCVMGEAGCGLLTDNFAQMWGDIKDSVDELKSVMSMNQANCKAREDALNAEIASMTAMLSQKNVELTEATGALNGNTEEQSEKISEKTLIENEYEEVHGECVAVLHDIMFSKICGTKTVRAELAKVADSYNPTDILDCEVSDWVAQECTKPCIPEGCVGDACIPGEQNMTRAVTQEASLGAGCPALTLVKTCGDIKCPINCEQTGWSEFGKCTKECGGGVQQRSRNVVQRALYGGEACAANSETQQCNVQSCDVDCVLGEWGAWMPCSKACGGGTQERMKPVMVPLAGKGICFGDKAIERYESTACNVDVCPPTATCNAMQDLVLAVDVSGSFQQAGFDLMSAFVQNLTSLYVMGPEAVQISIVEYSNVGKLVVPLTGDPTTLAKGLANLQFQRGITDMAAGLSLAKTALMEGRKDAQSVVVLLTDGKPSFQFATRNAASALRDAGVRLVVAPIMTFGDPSFMEELASDPPADNVLNINGLEHLSANGFAEAMMVMTSTCPKLDTPVVEVPKGGLDVAKVLMKADALRKKRRVHAVAHRRGH